MSQGEIETIYEALAIRLDTLGEQNRDLFLAKLVLLLARDVGDPGEVLQRMEDAAHGLEC